MQYLGKTKQLIPFPYVNGNKTENGVTYTVNFNGSIRITGTPTAYTAFIFISRQELLPNTAYTVSFGTPNKLSSENLAVSINLYDENSQLLRSYTSGENSCTFTTGADSYFINLQIKRSNDNVAIDTTIYPMLNEGETALPYQQYDKGLAVQAIGTSENLFKLPYADGLSKTTNGITFTVDEQTGWITANGTATANAQFSLWSSATGMALPQGEYLWADEGSVKDIRACIRFSISDRTNVGYYNYRYLYGNLQSEIHTINFRHETSYQIVEVNAGTTVNNLVFKPVLKRIQRYDMYLYNNLIKPQSYLSDIVNGTTVNGVSIIAVENGGLLLNGTSTASTIIAITNAATSVLLKAGTYVFNGVSGEGYNFYLQGKIVEDDSIGIATTYGPATFTLSQDSRFRFNVRFSAGYVFDNRIIYPKLFKLIGD